MTSPESPDGLTKQTVGGLAWVYGATAATASMQIAYTAVMGRLLLPADFGLLAMALVFQRFGTYFANMGVGQALIQKPTLHDEDIRVGFTTSLLLGCLVAILMAVAAPLAGMVFDTEDPIPIVRVLALHFVFSSLGMVSLNLLRRRLRFRALAAIELTTYSVAFIGVGIGMAVLGFGVWSLVGAQLTQSILQALLAYAAVRHPSTPLFAIARARVLYGYGARISVISFLEFAGANLPTLFIGRLAGQQALGHYNRAWMLVTLPLQHIATSLSRVLFPAFSRIQSDTSRLAGAYRSSISILSAIVIPVAVGMVVAAPEIVRVVIGPQWDSAAAVLPLLAIVGAVMFLSHLGGVICAAAAALNQKIVLQLLHITMLSLLLLAASVQGSLMAYAAAVVVGEIFRHVLYMRVLRRLLEVGVREHLVLYNPALMTAGLVAGGILGVSVILRQVAPTPAVLSAQISSGALIMLACFLWGPLVRIRHDIRGRLVASGLLVGEGRLVRVIRTLLETGR